MVPQASKGTFLRNITPTTEAVRNNMAGRVTEYGYKLVSIVCKNKPEFEDFILERSRAKFSAVTTNYYELSNMLKSSGIVYSSGIEIRFRGTDRLLIASPDYNLDDSPIDLEDAHFNKAPGVVQVCEKLSVIEDIYARCIKHIDARMFSHKELITLLPACRHFQDGPAYKRVPTHLYLKGAAEINADIAKLHFLLNLEGT